MNSAMHCYGMDQQNEIELQRFTHFACFLFKPTKSTNIIVNAYK